MSASHTLTLDELEPNGYLMLVCKDVGEILLRADQLPKVRAWQCEGPPGWVQAIDRSGDQVSLWWPTIRLVVVCTREGAAQERAIRQAAMADDDDRGWS